MNKATILWGIVGVLLLVLIFVGVSAAQVGSEASAMHDMLEADLKNHVSVGDLQAALTQKGYTVTPGPPFTAKGPVHSLIVYSTFLTVKADFSPDGKMTGYHLDRS